MEKIVKNNMYGVLWILLNNLVMCIQSTTIKKLHAHLDSAQIVFLYKLSVCVFALIWVCSRGMKGIRRLKTTKIHLHFLRAFLSLVAGMIFVKSLKHVPLADAMAIAFTEPLFATTLAVILLKEYLNRYCIFALFIGFIGTLIVLYPQANGNKVNVYALWVLGASVIWAIDAIVIKYLGKTEKSTQYIFYISLFSTMFSLPVAFRHWVPLENWHIPWILALAALYFIHLIAVFKAFQHANLSVLAPFDFSRIIFSTILGYIIFHDKIDMFIIAGSLIIISSSVYIVWNKEKVEKVS